MAPTEKHCYYCRERLPTGHLPHCPHTFPTRKEKIQAAYLYEDGATDALKVPDRRGPHSQDPTYLMAWNRVNDEHRGTKGPRVDSDYSFTHEVDGRMSLEEIREELLRNFGRKITISAVSGPWIAHGNQGYNCPVRAVDCDFLNGKISLPPIGSNLKIVVGHFI